jgi:hypothetical protein
MGGSSFQSFFEINMTRITAAQAGGLNRTPFLDMTATSKIGRELCDAPEHAQRRVEFDDRGPVQELHQYAVAYNASLHLPDFGPVSQNLIALKQIRERAALRFIDARNFPKAVALCSNIWACQETTTASTPIR